MGVVSITPCPHFTPGERTPGTHCTGGWVDPRAGLDAEARWKILWLCQGSNPSHPVRSQTLYWLSYPSSILLQMLSYNCSERAFEKRSTKMTLNSMNFSQKSLKWLKKLYKAIYIVVFLLWELLTPFCLRRSISNFHKRITDSRSNTSGSLSAFFNFLIQNVITEFLCVTPLQLIPPVLMKMA
jgi:hypothetical protein